MSEHGVLGLSTPWSRALFPGEARAEAEALVPVGYQINVNAVNGRPGPWHIVAYRVDPFTELDRFTTHSPQHGVGYMAQRLREGVAA